LELVEYVGKKWEGGGQKMLKCFEKLKSYSFGRVEREGGEV